MTELQTPPTPPAEDKLFETPEIPKSLPETKATDDLQGHQAFLALRPSLPTVEDTPKELPKTDLSYASRVILDWLPTFQRLAPDVRTRLAAPFGTAFDTALTRLPQTAAATIYCHLQYATLGKPTSKDAIDGEIKEGEALATKGKKWLKTLESLGRVSTEETNAILAGRGHEDTAKDLIRLGPLLTERWTILEALQPLEAEEGKRLTLADCQRMGSLGLSILRRLQNPDALPWVGKEADARKNLLQIAFLLENDYERVRQDIAYILRCQKRYAEADRLVSLRGISRPSTKPAEESVVSPPAPPTPPTPPAPPVS